jgi:hypothetical protein
VQCASRVAIALVVGLATLASVATGHVARTPTLGGKWSRSLVGIGAVRPSTIDVGGGAAGQVMQVRWAGWGGATARATGMAVDDPAGAPVSTAPIEQATVVAFHLGVCNGRRMYQGLEWYFPQNGESFSSLRFKNICDGTNAGYAVGSNVPGVYPQKTYPDCTARALVAALRRAGLGKEQQNRPWGCYGSFAYTGALVLHQNEVTVVFRASGRRWKVVSRDYCNGAIPRPIHRRACESN